MKTLLIVDIQKTMGHWFTWNYLKKVHAFLEQQVYEQIFMIVEPEYPADIWNRIKKGRFSSDILKEFKEDFIPEFIYKHLSKEPVYKIYNNSFWDNTDNSLETVTVPPKYEHLEPYTMHLNDEYRQLINELKASSQVDIIGGGLDKCVSLTERLLITQGIEPNVIENLCYDIRYINTNRRKINTFDTTPSKSIPMKLRDEHKQLKMKKVSFTKESVTTPVNRERELSA